MNIDLSNRQILITGASSGIGLDIAVQASYAGACTTLVARREDKLQDAIQRMKGEGHTYYVCDLSKPEETTALLEKLKEKPVKFDGMVYAAGQTCIKSIKLMNHDELSHLMNLNCFSFYELSRLFFSRKNCNPNSSIVAISSVAHKALAQGISAYAMSKAAMETAVKALAKELKHGIRANAILPGMITTDLISGIESDVIHEAFSKFKFGKVGDVTPLALYLLSDLSSFMTGSSLIVDGGLTI